MSDLELVKLSDSFAAYSEHIEGIDTIDGQTYELISQALKLESAEWSDADCIAVVENIIQNWHTWHKIDAGEEVTYEA